MMFDAWKVIKRGDVLSMRHALVAGLDPDPTTDAPSCTLLMCAAMTGNTSIGRLLIEHGAELDRKDQFGWTALSMAAHTGHHAFVKLLVDHGASLDGFPFGKSFEGFLDWAEQYGTGSREAMAKTKSVIHAARLAQQDNPAEVKLTT